MKQVLVQTRAISLMVAGYRLARSLAPSFLAILATLVTRRQSVGHNL